MGCRRPPSYQITFITFCLNPLPSLPKSDTITGWPLIALTLLWSTWQHIHPWAFDSFWNCVGLGIRKSISFSSLQIPSKSPFLVVLQNYTHRECCYLHREHCTEIRGLDAHCCQGCSNTYTHASLLGSPFSTSATRPVSKFTCLLLKLLFFLVMRN